MAKTKPPNSPSGLQRRTGVAPAEHSPAQAAQTRGGGSGDNQPTPDEKMAMGETRYVALPPPIEKSWWVQPGKLLAGAFPGDNDPTIADTKLNAMLNAGIRCVINLQEEEELNHGGRPFMAYRRRIRLLAAQRGSEISCLRFAIQDMDVPQRSTMELILDQIDSAISRRMPTYVHCWAGNGRTGTVIGCWLVRHGLSGEEALAQIARLREFDPFLRVRTSPQTDAQRSMIRTWLQWQTTSNVSREQEQEAASRGPVEMTGTHEAINYILRKGFTPATKSESVDFQFELGERRPRRQGLDSPKSADLRTIVGYAFDKQGIARYILKVNDNSLTEKEAHLSNIQYGPVVVMDMAVVNSLSLMLAPTKRAPRGR